MTDLFPDVTAAVDELRSREPVCACHLVRAAGCPALRRRPAEGLGLPVETRTDPRHLARLVDHTLLRPEATRDQIESLCDQSRIYDFGAVCVNPVWVELCVERLSDARTVVATVAGFPLGASRPEVKAEEARRGVADGAAEIDMVMNVGALRSGDHRRVLDDIAGVVTASGLAVVKVIIEAALLTDQEKALACRLAQLAGADFVKTSTGFGPGGATVADVALLRRVVGPSLGVKASAGIRDWSSARALLEAGADRIGTSAGVAILRESRGETP